MLDAGGSADGLADRLAAAPKPSAMELRPKEKSTGGGVLGGLKQLFGGADEEDSSTSYDTDDLNSMLNVRSLRQWDRHREEDGDTSSSEDWDAMMKQKMAHARMAFNKGFASTFSTANLGRLHNRPQKTPKQLVDGLEESLRTDLLKAVAEALGQADKSGSVNLLHNQQSDDQKSDEDRETSSFEAVAQDLRHASLQDIHGYLHDIRQGWEENGPNKVRSAVGQSGANPLRLAFDRPTGEAMLNIRSLAAYASTVLRHRIELSTTAGPAMQTSAKVAPDHPPRLQEDRPDAAFINRVPRGSAPANAVLDDADAPLDPAFGLADDDGYDADDDN